jgi:hypothetical protein
MAARMERPAALIVLPRTGMENLPVSALPFGSGIVEPRAIMRRPIVPGPVPPRPVIPGSVVALAPRRPVMRALLPAAKIAPGVCASALRLLASWGTTR